MDKLTPSELAELAGEDDNEEWRLMMCSMGRDGQCGQAGSEWCDFDCPIMDALRRKIYDKSLGAQS